MWQIKTFKTRAAMQAFLDRHASKIQWVEVFVNNAYAVEYRRLRKVC
jgi:hypothetical protein